MYNKSLMTLLVLVIIFVCQKMRTKSPNYDTDMMSDYNVKTSDDFQSYETFIEKEYVNKIDKMEYIIENSRQFSKYKDQYHWFSDSHLATLEENRNVALFLDLVYDARVRESNRTIAYIRSIVTSSYPLERLPLYAILAYESSPPFRTECQLQLLRLESKLRAPNRYYVTTVECRVPSKAPAYVTLTHRLEAPATHRVAPSFVLQAATQAQLAQIEQQARISVCCSNVYGEFTTERVLYFVNRMEALLMFGVSSVTMNYISMLDATGVPFNSGSKYGHPLLDRAVKHYLRAGVLTVTHIKPALLRHDYNIADWKSLTFSIINMIATRCALESAIRGDWFYTVLDIDEFFVPQDGSRTYQELLRKVAQTDENFSRYAMVAGMSRGHYTFYRPDERQPHYLPVLRYNQHGYSDVKPHKSFRRPDACYMSNTHRCATLPSFLATKMLPKEKLINYHFRASCKEHVVIEDCAQEERDRKQSTYFEETFGADLKIRVERVLLALGYNIETF